MHKTPPPSSACGLTLIELLIVVVILATLSAVVIPAFSESKNSSDNTQNEASRRIMQHAIDRYYLDHGEHPSGSKLDNPLLCDGGKLLDIEINNKAATLVNQLMLYSDVSGKVCNSRQNGLYPYGPYINNLPINTACDNGRIGVIYGTDEKIYDRPNHGWGYLPKTGEFAYSNTCE